MKTKTKLLPFQQLLLAFLLLLGAAAPSFAAAPQADEEDFDEIEMMFEAVEFAAYEIGIETEDMFAALAHGLSCAQVAIAHQGDPADLIEAMASFEESEILDLLIDEEIDLDEAAEWRDDAWSEITWFVNEPDPFDLEDVIWLFDGAGEALDMELLEMLEWMSEDTSIATLAEFMEVELGEVEELALDRLESNLEQLVILEEIDEQEAEGWMAWIEEELESMLHDEQLLETLAEDAWFEGIMMELADLLDLDEEELWQALEEGEDLEMLIEDSGIGLEELIDEIGAEELDELFGWLYEDGEDEGFDDFDDFDDFDEDDGDDEDETEVF
jgi:hypothetical protein